MIEHEFEPVPGLPEDLPDGESILWQGAPDWRVLARRAFHLRSLALYFAVLLVIRLGAGLWFGDGMASALTSAALLAGLGACAAALFLMMAWLIARSTLYTLTNKRLVMRFGIALPMSVNLPFAHIQAAAVKAYPGGFGDIPITLDRSHRVSYIVMWPHVRPWLFRRPEPMLRGIADAKAVAERLADAASGTASAEQSPAEKAADGTQVGAAAVPAQAAKSAAGAQGGSERKLASAMGEAT